MDILGHIVIWVVVLSPAAATLVVMKTGALSINSARWMCMAYLVSVPGDVGRLLGYPWGAEWTSSNIYPALQISLFAVAVAGTYPALIVGLALASLGSIHVMVAGFTEPGMAVRAAGGILVGILACDGDQEFRDPVVMYCVGGAIAWILWFPYMQVYGLGAWLGYTGYHLTRFVSFGLFIHAAHRWSEP